MFRHDWKDAKAVRLDSLHHVRWTVQFAVSTLYLYLPYHRRADVDFVASVGNESEDVLLLSEEVRNQSVPVILCSEEDVVGNHGASIGRPDEDMLFYMETRGVDEETACEMLAQAKIDSVIRKIPDASIRDMLQEKTCTKAQGGE